MSFWLGGDEVDDNRIISMEIISVMSRCPWPNDTYHFPVTEHYQNYWHQVQHSKYQGLLKPGYTFSFDQTSWFSNLTLGWENYFWKEAVVNNFNWLSRESAVKAVCNHTWQFYREHCRTRYWTENCIWPGCISPNWLHFFPAKTWSIFTKKIVPSKILTFDNFKKLKIIEDSIFMPLENEEDKFCLHHNCPKGFGHKGLGHDIAIFWKKSPLLSSFLTSIKGD